MSGGVAGWRQRLARWLWTPPPAPACRCIDLAPYLDVLKPLTPPEPSGDPTEAMRRMVHTASIMEDLDKQEGWRDVVGKVRAARAALIEDLALGKFRPERKPPLTTPEIQAIVFALDMVVAIPESARRAYADWFASQQAQLAAAEKLDARLDNVPYSAGAPV